MDNNEIKNTYKIWAYRAIDNMVLCEEYLAGHIKILTDYGITNITSNHNAWLKNPFMYCVVAQDIKTGELVGGIRIQIADGVTPLPIEKAIGYMDERIYSIVKEYAFNGGVGELNGLWVSNKLKGQGMGPILVRAAIAAANQLNFITLIGICGENTLQMFKNVGFLIETNLGINGGFPYPTKDLTAHVVGIMNAVTLESAASFDKAIMENLRANPRTIRNEVNNAFVSEINYDLLYDNITENEYGIGSMKELAC